MYRNLLRYIPFRLVPKICGLDLHYVIQRAMWHRSIPLARIFCLGLLPPRAETERAAES